MPLLLARNELYIALGASMLLAFLIQLWSGYLPGGYIAAGYLAVVWHDPVQIAMVLGITMVTLGVNLLLNRWMFLFGRRRFIAAMMVAVLLSVTAQSWRNGLVVPALEARNISFIVPGLLANQCLRQGVTLTLVYLALATAVIFALLAMVWWV